MIMDDTKIDIIVGRNSGQKHIDRGYLLNKSGRNAGY